MRPSSPRSSRISSTTADRKSTRLNSCHLVISYAVFCLTINVHELLPFAIALSSSGQVARQSITDYVRFIVQYWQVFGTADFLSLSVDGQLINLPEGCRC